MSIPKNINRTHILSAIDKIKKEGFSTESDSQYYDVVYEGERYPPKLLISYANIFANGVTLDRKTFSGGSDTPCFKMLEKEGFVIKKKKDTIELPRIFIAPRSGEQSTEHFEKTIKGGYNKSKLEHLLTEDDKVKLINEEILMIWGSKPSLKSRWEKMQIDDWVLFYQHGKITYAGRLLYKTHNKKLADGLWGPQEVKHDEPVSWEYVFFIKELQEVKIPYKKMSVLAGYKGSVVQGFQPYSEIGVQNIISEYGSIDRFINIEDQIKNIPIETTLKSNLADIDMDILIAMKTKPFILLAGISGTGKSRLVRTLAYNTCIKEELKSDPRKPGNFELIPVKPNWHDSSELMGYISRINGEKYITTTFLKFIAKSWKHKDVPFFLCLDEMNLAPVEQYFAEYLSIIETRQLKNNEVVTDYILSKDNFEDHNLYSQLLRDLELSGNEFNEGISIPSNLIVIGTVNMDETTHSFSRKVLDRAITFEMNNVDLAAGLDISKNDWVYPKSFLAYEDVIGQYTSGAEVYSLDFKEKYEVINYLKSINNELEGTPFKIAYRVRDEFLIYCYYASKKQTGYSMIRALDEMTCMKILSRIEGDEIKTGKVLTNLQRIVTADYKKSNAKIKEMETRLQSNGYTSFWS